MSNCALAVCGCITLAFLSPRYCLSRLHEVVRIRRDLEIQHITECHKRFRGEGGGCEHCLHLPQKATILENLSDYSLFDITTGDKKYIGLATMDVRGVGCPHEGPSKQNHSGELSGQVVALIQT